MADDLVTRGRPRCLARFVQWAALFACLLAPAWSGLADDGAFVVSGIAVDQTAATAAQAREAAVAEGQRKGLQLLFERLVPAAPLIKLPETIGYETAAAMTMRGLTAAYLMRRIYPFRAGDSILLHAAAGGVGLIVSQWARLLGLSVIGTVSTEAKAEVARAHGCDQFRLIGRRNGAGHRICFGRFSHSWLNRK